MACVGTDNPCFIAGDDLLYAIQRTENDKVTPIDLTGATAKMDLKDAVTDVAVVKTMSGGIVDAANGLIHFTLTDDETEALLPRAEVSNSWVFSVKLTYSDASERTILAGTLTLEQVATA